VRDALVSPKADNFRAKSGRSPTATESLFSCVAKRKVTKREGHPAWRLPPILGRQVRELGPGFSTGLLSWRKGVDIPIDSRFAACRPQLTAAQGPRVEQRAILARTRWKAERLESNSNSTNESGGEARLCGCSAVAPAFLKSTRRMRVALPGAPLKRRAGEGKPAGWFAWMRTSLASVHGWTVDKPRSPHADFPGMDARKARKRGGLLFGYLSLGHARESNSPSEGGRKLFALRLSTHKEQQATASRLKSLLQIKAQASC
jgi:hypothetical protein